MRSQWGRQEDAATVGRRALHERVDNLAREVAINTSVTTATRKDLDEIKQEIEQKVMPTVTAYNLEIARRAGMWLMGRLFWAVVLAIATVAGFFIHEGFQYLRGNGSAVAPPSPPSNIKK